MNLMELIYWMICSYVIMLPIINEKYLAIGKLPDLVLILIILLYLVYILKSNKNRKEFFMCIIDFFKSKLGISMIILTIMMVISTLYAKEKTLALMESFRFITYIILVFIIKYNIKDSNRIKNIIRCIVISVTILTTFGLIQYFTTIGLEPRFISEEGTRITSTMQNPNGFGAYLVLMCFPIFMLSFVKKSSKKIYIPITILIIVNIFFTYSRNAIVGLAIGVFALAIMYNYKVLFIFLLGIPVMIFGDNVINRFDNIGEKVLRDPRIKLWKVAMKMIKDNPILGVGNGNYVARYDEYIERYPELAYQDYTRFSSHNSYLKMQSELGIVGLISFLLVIVCSINTIYKAYKNLEDKELKLFFMGVMASTVAFLAMNLLDNLFFSPQTTTYFWVFVALGENVLFNKRYEKNK